MEAVWYFVVNGVSTGPVSWAELKQAATAGKFGPGDLVWKEGMPEWVPARTVADLFPGTAPTPPAPPATYGVSPPPAATKPAPEPLSLDDEPEARNKPRRRDRDAAATPAQMPEWVKLVEVFVRRAFNPNPAQAAPLPEEEAALTRSGVMDATARKLAVWRRSVLFVAAVPCAFAAIFGLFDVLDMGKDEREGFSAFGLLILYLQALALFALPVAAVMGALAYDRLSVSAKWVLAGGLVSFAVPLAVAFVPGGWLIDIDPSGDTPVAQVEAARSAVGIVLGVLFYVMLMPAVLSLLPAVSRACIRLKMLLPESLVPGWGLVTSAPLCVLLTLATFVLLYHLVGNALLVIGLLLWIGAPLVYLTKFSLLTRPVTNPADRAALGQLSHIVAGLILLGMLFLLIFMLTTKVGGKTLLGFSESKSVVRPWSLLVLKTATEYLGRSLFLSIFFADLLLRMALSVWREERAFAGSPEAAGFDRTMTGLGSAILPRGSSPPPSTEHTS
jgi:hypothetical protein